MLEVQHDRALHDLVTLDDLWFYLNTDHEFASLTQGKKFLNAGEIQFNRNSSSWRSFGIQAGSI
jgi:hypothetical protein